jgi:hypothetical protein
MFNKSCLSAGIAALCIYPFAANAVSDADLQEIRSEIQTLKQGYEARIAQLEQRLKAAEEKQTEVTQTVATQAGIRSQPVASTGGEGAFNPAMSLILAGTYGGLQRSPTVPATGFSMSANPGHQQGFNLGESELGISATIDPDYRGAATLSLAPAGGVTVENAFVQTSSLGNGVNLKFGRYFSGLGYLNEQHAHAWDFVDQPLVYATLWNNQLGEDGVQLKWVAPTDTFIELGGEVGRGRGFPGSDRTKNGAGSGVLFAHIGDDIGIEHSWRAGASLHQTRRVNALSTDAINPLINNSFSGDSRTAGLDLVWKYSPNGNTANRYLKVQGEYFQRKESGMLTYDAGIPAATLGPITDTYANTQSGWYLQSVYQFMPNWRSGIRYDRMNPGTASVGALNAGNIAANYGFNPSRATWMLDYSPSEFSRLRLQLARDNSRLGLPDNQLFLQYIMSLGAHGAHQY